MPYRTAETEGGIGGMGVFFVSGARALSACWTLPGQIHVNP